jgi:peptidoglycan/LPS O-acetylase OafA/YrhL
VRRLGYEPSLDGLRGVAILLVISRHTFLEPIGGGYGVDLFFVLSGYLITTLLLDERDDTGRIRLGAFYARRARRLLPALAAMLAVFLAVEIAVGRARDAFVEVAAGGFYTANIFQAWWPHVIGRSGIGPLWSLAQEEQFYLVAPMLLIAVVAWRGERAMARVLALLIAAVLVERLLLLMHGAELRRIYSGPDTHSDGLLVGSLLALGLRHLPARNSIRARNWLAFAGPLLFAVPVLLGPGFPIAAPFNDLAGAAMVCCAVSQPASPLTCLLASRPLVFVGKISYSLYLWNGVLLIWLHGDANGIRFGEPYTHVRAFAAVALTFAVAYASHRFVEQPFRRRRTRVVAEPAAVPVAAVR